MQVKKAGSPAGHLSLPAWSDAQVTTFKDGKMHAASPAGQKELKTKKQLEKQKQEKLQAHEEKSLAKGKCSRLADPAAASAASKESTPRTPASIPDSKEQKQVMSARCCSPMLMMVLLTGS